MSASSETTSSVVNSSATVPPVPSSYVWRISLHLPHIVLKHNPGWTHHLLNSASTTATSPTTQTNVLQAFPFSPERPRFQARCGKTPRKMNVRARWPHRTYSSICCRFLLPTRTKYNSVSNDPTAFLTVSTRMSLCISVEDLCTTWSRNI
ncbi:hypothetical protein H4582DRAFT_1907427 [Lactarius indigo]|nr:hypothetical protein H4582DRAFT_1907427 [Lactarius indigo]